MSALIRACLKKRARGIFTYTGLRYDDGRADLRLSIESHTRNAIQLINDAVFDNGQTNRSRHGDAMTIRVKPDLVYLDPPYFSELSDNEYVRRYHFVEGLARNWENVEMQWHTKTKKFKSYPTPFSSRSGAEDAFDKLFSKLRDSILIVSYSSNSLPSREQIISIMSKYKRHVEVIDIDHRYSFGNQSTKSRNAVKEYLFVGFYGTLEIQPFVHPIGYAQLLRFSIAPLSTVTFQEENKRTHLHPFCITKEYLMHRELREEKMHLILEENGE